MSVRLNIFVFHLRFKTKYTDGSVTKDQSGWGFISEKQATCEGCFARQSICSVVGLHSDMARAVHPQEFSTIDAFQSELPIPLSVASSLNL